MQFCNFNGVTMYKLNTPKSGRYAMFDLDDTLIKYTSTDAFIPLYETTFSRLNELIDRDYNIIIITSRPKITQNVKKLMAQIIKRLKQTTSIFIYIASSTVESIYLKPRMGVYITLVHCFFNGHVPNKYSFYVGDGYRIGRTGDVNLAKNLNLHFSTPDQFFNTPLSQLKLRKPVGVGYKPKDTDIAKPWHDTTQLRIVLSGDAGTGKSFYAKKILSDYKLYYRLSEFLNSKYNKKILILRKLTDQARDECLKKLTDCTWYHLEASNDIKRHNLIYYNMIAHQLNEPKHPAYTSCTLKKPMISVNYTAIPNLSLYYTFLS